jgi:hypothetical protein
MGAKLAEINGEIEGVTDTVNEMKSLFDDLGLSVGIK